MTREEKIAVLAELDGYTGDVLPNEWAASGYANYNDKNECQRFVPPYLTSYDAIIPLVKKRCAGNALMEQTFINEVERGICSGFHAARTVGFFPMAAEPEQLADALIRAAGKWME